MYRFLFVLVLIATGVVGLGFYLGWFSLDWDRGGGKGHLTITVNEAKVQEDEKKLLEKVKGLESPVKGKGPTENE